MTDSDGVGAIVVYGATGLTGGLVVDALRSRGVLPIIAGRNERKLRTVAEQRGLPASLVAVVEPDDTPALARLVERGRVVVSCAGPFTAIGEPVVAACATHGVHYVDSTGEVRFVQMVARRYGPTAEANGVALVPSMAFEVAVGDAAAARAAAKLQAPIDLDIVYGVTDFATSVGTRATALAVAAQDSMAVQDGELRDERVGTSVISVPFRDPLGEMPAFSFASPELVTVPHHVPIHTMHTHLAMKRAAWMPWLSRPLPLVMKLATPLARRWLEQQGTGGPTPERMAASRFQIVADARASDGRTRRRVTVTGSDIYRLSGALLAEAAMTLARGTTSRGFRAPSQVVSAERVFELVRTFENGALHVEEWS